MQTLLIAAESIKIFRNFACTCDLCEFDRNRAHFNCYDFSVLQRTGSVMDVENVPEQACQEAEKRADVLRPLAALAEAPAALVRDAARELSLSERWTCILIHRLREHGGELTALLPRQGRGAPREARMSSGVQNGRTLGGIGVQIGPTLPVANRRVSPTVLAVCGRIRGCWWWRRLRRYVGSAWSRASRSGRWLGTLGCPGIPAPTQHRSYEARGTVVSVLHSFLCRRSWNAIK